MYKSNTLWNQYRIIKIIIFPVRSLVRKASDISVSSQSSVEEDDIEAKRKRFARKGSRDSSLQDFLEDRLSESKRVTKGRLSSTSSTSIDVSMDEDSGHGGERNPGLERLIAIIHHCFTEKEQEAAQKEAKMKRARMQRQPTIDEEPDSKYRNQIVSTETR
jgi:hypothetical protein